MELRGLCTRVAKQIIIDDGRFVVMAAPPTLSTPLLWTPASVVPPPFSATASVTVLPPVSTSANDTEGQLALVIRHGQQLQQQLKSRIVDLRTQLVHVDSSLRHIRQRVAVLDAWKSNKPTMSQENCVTALCDAASVS